MNDWALVWVGSVGAGRSCRASRALTARGSGCWVWYGVDDMRQLPQCLQAHRPIKHQLIAVYVTRRMCICSIISGVLTLAALMSLLQAGRQWQCRPVVPGWQFLLLRMIWEGIVPV